MDGSEDEYNIKWYTSNMYSFSSIFYF